MTSLPTPLPDEARCPCGLGDPFGDCCGPVLRQERRAATAETLMRSRYTAFALRDVEHLLRTWHPQERPAREALAASLEDGTRWLHLEILGTVAGGPFDDEGTVEFVATARTPQGRHAQHEVSRFVRDDGAWLYVSAQNG